LKPQPRTGSWEQFSSGDKLRNHINFEKLLVGCEIIPVLDRIDPLAA